MEYELEPDSVVLPPLLVKYYEPSILWHISYLERWKVCASDAEFYTTMALIDIIKT
jgi:hypothetical protein